MARRKTKRRRRAKSLSARAINRALENRAFRDNHPLPPRGSDQSLKSFGRNMKQIKFDINYGDDLAKKNAQQQLATRNQYRYYGPGGYWDRIKQVGKWGLRAGGAAVGAAAAIASGNMDDAYIKGRDGWYKGAAASKYLGMGDYTNQLVQGGPPGANMNISVNPLNETGDIFYSNTEFVGNIFASVPAGPSTSTFELRKYEINPGLGAVFPFLSQLSQNFDLYEFYGLMFHYKPTSGEFGNNSSNSLGKVIMVTNYDPDAKDFRTAIEMENYDYASSCKPSCTLVHGVETDPTQRATRMLYTRDGPSSKNRIFTDIGNFYVGTEGIPFGGAGAQRALIGELWVSYGVRLSRSKLYETLGEGVLYRIQTMSATSSVWNAANSVATQSKINVSFSGDATLVMTHGADVPNGRYFYSIRNTGSISNVTNNASDMVPFNANTVNSRFSNSTGASTSAFIFEYIYDAINAGTTTITFNRAAISNGTWQVVLIQVDPDFNF